MDKEIIYVNNLESNGVKCPELTVNKTIKITDSYVIYRETATIIYYAPIKTVISHNIVQAKYLLNDLEKEKQTIGVTKTHIQSLSRLIKLMEKVELDFTNEDLKYLYLFDGLKNERQLAKQSYTSEKENTNRILKEQTKNYKTQKKNIKIECLEKVSLLLKNNGLKNHRNSASVILNDNGIDIPSYL